MLHILIYHLVSATELHETGTFLCLLLDLQLEYIFLDQLKKKYPDIDLKWYRGASDPVVFPAQQSCDVKPDGAIVIVKSRNDYLMVCSLSLSLSCLS